MMDKNEIVKWAKDRRVQWAATIVIFLIILVLAVQLRTANLPILVDSTTGKAATADLDAYYFLRITTTLYNTGSLPAVDEMRSPGQNISFIYEKMPQFTVFMYKIIHPFNSSLQIDKFAMMAPAIFFAIGLVLFFILVLLLTNSRVTALLASGFISFIQGYMFRSMSGVFDHDVFGMIPLFATFIFLTLALKNVNNWKKNTVYSILTGLATIAVVAAWGGALTFVLMVLPFAVFLKYLYHTEKEEKLKYISLLGVWLVSSVIFCLVFSLPFWSFISRFKESLGIITPFVFLFILIDFGLDYLRLPEKVMKYLKYQKFVALVITLVLGVVGLAVLGKNVFVLFEDIWFKLIYPFGLGRLGITVAENAQPHLADWISQYGELLVWFFAIGAVAIGISAGKTFDKKQRLIFSGAWALLIVAALLSRISDSAKVLNGEGFISQAFYFIGLASFFGYFLYLSFKTTHKIDSNYALLLSLMIFTLINGRSAARSFFLITPFICLAAAYLINALFRLSVDSFRGIRFKEWRYMIAIIFIALLFMSLGTIKTAYVAEKGQTKYIGPSEGQQWQQTMSWVRENTNKEDIFVHWWDYGYWLQTIGERTTVTDGGHSGGDQADHYIGRYILTTENPTTALSFMKTWNVSYLLIDQTELGKYSAYSRIGSDETWDRYSMIPVGAVDQTQIQETSKGEKRVYQIGSVVDEDIVYNNSFIPGPSFDEYGRASFKASIAGAITETVKENGQVRIKQPIGVYIYNGNQIRIPLRYVYFSSQLIDFGSGLEAGVVLIPQVSQNAQGAISIDQMGGMIYLSPKVYPSLYAQLYLMNDPHKIYPSLKLAHSEDDPVVSSLKSQTSLSSDMIVFGGFRGPIKIWKTEYPANTQVHPEFFSSNFTYGGLDELFN